ncbi:MAG: flagellin lysine-N-methylase [Candidatus Scalinduaceae bacterium]
MNRFICTGSECEDSCCINWKIYIDKDYYNMLEKRMNTTRANRDKFQASVERIKNHGNPEKYAALKLRTDGTCSFLNKDGLCNLQRDYGESILCNTCASYPRIITIIGKRVELASTLSCPEVARQCLLEEDATDLVKFDLGTLPREIPGIAIETTGTDPFLNYVDVVKHTIFKLLSLQQYSINTRLFFCVYFAKRTSPFYHKNTTNFSEDSLAKEILWVENPEVIDELYKKYNAMEFHNTFTMTLIQSILISSIKEPLNIKFERLALDCLKTYQAVGDVTDNRQIEMLISCEELLARYEERKLYWESNYGERIDIYFTNYFRNCWIKDIYANSPGLLEYFSNLLLRFAILRFLFFSHPDLKNLQMERSIVIDSLDKVIVKVVYLFTKRFEHDKELIEGIQESLERKGTINFAHLVLLLKF